MIEPTKPQGPLSENPLSENPSSDDTARTPQDGAMDPNVKPDEFLRLSKDEQERALAKALILAKEQLAQSRLIKPIETLKSFLPLGFEFRLATPADQNAIFDICVKTAAAGKDAAAFGADPELIAQVWVAPYLYYTPKTAFVLTKSSKVVGYAVGCRDTEMFEDMLLREWWPALAARYPLNAPWSVADQPQVNQIHRAKRTPVPLRRTRPAHMHMNLLPEARGRGLGRSLAQAWMAHLGDPTPRGVHVGIDPKNKGAEAFWTAIGFAPCEAISNEHVHWLARALPKVANPGA